MPPKKRRKTTSRRPNSSAASKPRKKTRRRAPGNDGSVDAGVQNAMDSFLPKEAKAQHDAGEKEFARTYGNFMR